MWKLCTSGLCSAFGTYIIPSLFSQATRCWPCSEAPPNLLSHYTAGHLLGQGGRGRGKREAKGEHLQLGYLELHCDSF